MSHVGDSVADGDISSQSDAETDLKRVENGEKIKLVCNDLLTYVQFYTHRCTNENLKKTICRFYAPESKHEAKNALWDAVAEFKILGRKQNHKKSTSREAHEADTTDIICAMQKLERAKSNVIRFVHYDLDNIPKYSPETSHPSETQNQVAQHEQRLTALENQSDSYNESLKSLEAVVQDVLNQKKPSYSQTLRIPASQDLDWPNLSVKTPEST